MPFVAADAQLFVMPYAAMPAAADTPILFSLRQAMPFARLDALFFAGCRRRYAISLPGFARCLRCRRYFAIWLFAAWLRIAAAILFTPLRFLLRRHALRH